MYEHNDTQFLQKFIQMYLLVLCMHINITTTCSKICFQHMLLNIFFDAMFTEKQTYHKWIFLMDMTMCSNHILLPVAGLCCTNIILVREAEGQKCMHTYFLEGLILLLIIL